MPRTVVLVCMAALLLGLAACGTAAPVADDAPIADLPLTAQGLGEVTFGMDPDAVLTALEAVLGGPSTDTDWLDTGTGIYGECPTPLRVISWGSLATFHSGGPERGTFFAYSYGFDYEEALAGVDPRGLNLTTPEGIGIGSAVAELQSLDADVALDGDEIIDVWTFAIDETERPHLRGQVTGIESTDIVLFLETSPGCE